MWKRKFNNKFNNTKEKAYGYSFDSKFERAVFEYLMTLQKSGVIKNLMHHPGTVYLTDSKIGYRPDFSWFNIELNREEWGEAKGMETEVYRIKKKLWKNYGPGVLIIYKGNAKRFYEDEIVMPE